MEIKQSENSNPSKPTSAPVADTINEYPPNILS